MAFGMNLMVHSVINIKLFPDFNIALRRKRDPQILALLCIEKSNDLPIFSAL